MKRNRNLLVLCLGLALTAGLSCTGELPLANEVGVDSIPSAPVPPVTPSPVDTGSVAPVDSVPVTPTDTFPIPPDDTTSVPPDSAPTPESVLLTCEPQPYVVVTAEIDRKGGLLTVGNHSLKIPQGALSHPVTITMEQVEGPVNSVRFSPEGLHFETPAVLTLSYKNCGSTRHWKHIVYTDEMLNILEPTLSMDFSSSSQVKGLIYHFSRYAVAY